LGEKWLSLLKKRKNPRKRAAGAAPFAGPVMPGRPVGGQAIGDEPYSAMSVPTLIAA
jgi:hypothetical protein